jgi:hypothetical protein
MTQEIRRQPSRSGHGLHPVCDRQWDQRRDDAQDLKVAMESRITPEWSAELEAAVERMALHFSDISRNATRDWFISSKLMSHPSPRLAGRISAGLKRLNNELIKDDIEGINAALENLEGLYLPKIIDRYLDFTRPKSPEPFENHVGWAYMLSSSVHPSMVMAGATEGRIEDLVSETNKANPDLASFGIVSAWRVTDTTVAAELVTKELAETALENGFFFSDRFRGLWDMKQNVDDALMAAKIVVANPMFMPNERKPIMSIRPFSHDISNRKFKSDVDSVFDAFRR